MSLGHQVTCGHEVVADAWMKEATSALLLLLFLLGAQGRVAFITDLKKGSFE